MFVYLKQEQIFEFDAFRLLDLVLERLLGDRLNYAKNLASHPQCVETIG